MFQKHKRKMYPPRIITTVTAKTQGVIFKLKVKFKGCSRESQLDRDLSFPLGILLLHVQSQADNFSIYHDNNIVVDVPTSPTSIASSCSIGAESRDILSKLPVI